MTATHRLAMTQAELAAFLDGAFTVSARPAFGRLVLAEPGHVRMRLAPTPDMLRPGDSSQVPP